jgi:hypothetical protein
MPDRYEREVGQVELLSYPDQLRLARAVEAGTDAAARLAGRHRLADVERGRLEAVADAGERARRAFVETNLRLVMAEVRRYPVSTTQAFVELVQAGNIALVHAADRFDRRCGVRFSTYAQWWVHQAVAQSWAATDHAVGDEIARPDPVAIDRYRQLVAELDVGAGPVARLGAGGGARAGATVGAGAGSDRRTGPGQPVWSTASLTGAVSRSSAGSPSGPIPCDRM